MSRHVMLLACHAFDWSVYKSIQNVKCTITVWHEILTSKNIDELCIHQIFCQYFCLLVL